MVRSGRRCLFAALVLVCGGSAFAQRPLVFVPEPTPAAEPLPPAPRPGLSPLSEEMIPMPVPPAPAPNAMPVSDYSHFAGTPSAGPAVASPQAACCGATAAVAASCCPAPQAAPCGPATTCGCATGAAASFAAFAPAPMYPGSPNSGSSCCGQGGPGFPGPVGNAFQAAPSPYGAPQYGAGPFDPSVTAFPNASSNALYAGGYANGEYGFALSGAWPTHYGRFAGAAAYSGYPMGVAVGGTAGEHVRNPYYNDRRPWYTPGPGSRTVSIVW